MRTSTIVAKSEVEQEKVIELNGTSLFCLSKTNGFRLFNYKLAENVIFERTILVLIIISTITLALETPLDDPKGDKVMIL